MQLNAKNALHRLAKEKDGVDGSNIYMYLFSNVDFYWITPIGEFLYDFRPSSFYSCME